MTLVKPRKVQSQRGPVETALQLLLILLLGMVVLGFAWASAERSRIASTETVDALKGGSGRYLEVGGLSVHLRDRGLATLPVLLLIHGFNAAGGAVWDLAESSFDQHRVLVPDMIDFGYSSRVTEPGRVHTVIGRAELLGDLLEELETGPVAVVGSGYGGAVAAQLAIIHPELVSSLVIVAGEIYQPAPGLGERLAGFPFLGPAVAFNLWGAADRAERRFTAGCQAGGFCPPAGLVEQRRRAAVVVGTADALAAMAATQPASTVVERLATIAKPTLILWGEKDTVTPLADARRLEDEISDSTLQIVVGAGHQPEVENPTATAELIRSFLAGR
jgi:pimeloyl-ACP methyl ester carboxylesterase